MTATLYFVALALVGVDLGYQPLPNGGGQFILQVNLATLQSLRPGEELTLDVPAEAQTMRPNQFKILLGTGALPHEVPVAAPPELQGTPPAVGPTASPHTTFALPQKFENLSAAGADGSNGTPADRPWVWLIVIGLLASNFYVGWLFVDARQRHGLLLRRSMI